MCHREERKLIAPYKAFELARMGIDLGTIFKSLGRYDQGVMDEHSQSVAKRKDMKDMKTSKKKTRRKSAVNSKNKEIMRRKACEEEAMKNLPEVFVMLGERIEDEVSISGWYDHGTSSRGKKGIKKGALAAYTDDGERFGKCVTIDFSNSNNLREMASALHAVADWMDS